MPPIPILLMIQHLDGGGTERHVHDLALGLDRSLFQVHVIHFGPGEMARRLAEAGGPAVTLMPLDKGTGLAALRTAMAVRRYIARHRIRLVMTFHFVADLVGAAASLGRPRPLLVQSRRDMGFTRNWRQRTAGRWLDRRVDGYIAVSEAVRRAVAGQEGVDPAKIRVIHNGTELAALRAGVWDVEAERRRLGIEPGELVIGCVANFNPVKGHAALIEAFHRLRRVIPRSRLLLAGDGPMRDQIREAVASHGLEGAVLMTGSSRDVGREYRLSDVVVLPSRSEGFSNSIVEAMGLGRPVVACRVGGNPEAIEDGVTGLLVEPFDPEALAGALARLAGDEPMRRRLGEAARAEAERRFSLETMLAHTADFLLERLGEKPLEPLAQKLRS